VCVAFVKENVFANEVRLGETCFHFAKLKGNLLVDIAAVSVFMNTRLIDHDTFFNRRNCLQRLVLNLDQIHRVKRDVLVNRRHCSYRIANEADLIYTKGVLVLADGENAVRNRKVFSGDDRYDSKTPEGFREVNVLYMRMRQMAAQNLAIKHAR